MEYGDLLAALGSALGAESAKETEFGPSDNCDAETALVVCRGARSESLFVRGLHQALIVGKADHDDWNDRTKIRKDLYAWLRSEDESDPLIVWLKFKIEQFPIRLFVVCDWKGIGGVWHPSQDQFWFDLQSAQKFASKQEAREAGEGVIWSTPDPRPWRGESWRRFFGKRICWIEPRMLEEEIGGWSQPAREDGREEPGQGLSGRKLHSRNLGLLASFLRERWVEHLACRVRGLDWEYGVPSGEIQGPYGGLRIVVGLKASDTKDAHHPLTVPLRQSDLSGRFLPHGGDAASRSARGDGRGTILRSLARLTFRGLLRDRLGAELTWSQRSNRYMQAILQMHTEVISRNENGGWETNFVNDIHRATDDGTSGAKPALLFGASLSGSLPSHNSLLDLSASLETTRAGERFLDIAEHVLLRVAVCDERYQAWWNGDIQHAEGAVQRHVFSLFWQGPSLYKQAPAPGHGLWGDVLTEDGHCSLRINGAKSYVDYLDIVFRHEPWPVSAEILLIHQGILDKWKGSSGLVLARELCKLKDTFPWVVVTSGRGKPDGIPKGVRFLPFAALQGCVVGRRIDKLLLIRQLIACGGEV